MHGTVVVVGSFTRDTILRDGVSRDSIGGVVSYAGLTYLRHGLRTRLCFNLAPEDQALTQPLADAGAELFIGRSQSTTLCYNELDGDERQQSMPSTARAIDAAELSAASRDEIALVHLGPLHPGDLAPDALVGIPSVPIVCDLQGLARSIIDGDVVNEVERSPEPFMSRATIVKGSAEEVELVLDAMGMGMEEFLRSFQVEELVETRGSRGGTIHTRDGRAVDYDAVKVANGDPTGAGDVFFAAYIWARRSEGYKVKQAAEYAAGVAAEQVAGDYISRSLLALS